MLGAEGLLGALAALLGAWLGLTVLARSPFDRAARVFAFATLLMAVWSGAIALRHLATDPAAELFLEFVVQGAAGALLPAALLHLALAFAFGSRMSAVQRGAVTAAYVVGGMIAVWAFIAPEQPLRVNEPHLELAGVPGEVLGWGWVAVRIAILALAPLWAWRGLLAVASDRPRRLQAAAVLAAVSLAAIGGSLRAIPPGYLGPEWLSVWLGMLLIIGALLSATYAVLAQRVFLAPRIARRALTGTVFGGVAVVLLVAILIGLEELVANMLGLDVPVVFVVALAVTLAVFDPVREGWRTLLDRWSQADPARRRLLRVIGGGQLTVRTPEATIGPALSRLAWRFDLTGASVEAGGRVVAIHGQPDEGPLSVSHAAGVDDEEVRVRFGAKRSGLTFTTDELALLERAAVYIFDALSLSERQGRQVRSLDALTRDAAEHESEAHSLQEAIGSGSGEEDRLHVFGLGPLRVERGGALIRSWGGAKAGTRQAEAIFAFLYDRGARGVSKDEFLEVIWPDVPVDRADAAFHRTLNGLRHTLEPGWRRASKSGAITFHNDRYHLDPALIAWADVDAFRELLTEARRADEPETALTLLERARALYRGEYLDDCPFYGDSADVDDRRTLMRGQFVDLLIMLGERYEARADRSNAAGAFREALLVSGEELAPARAGLARLGAPS